MNDFIIARNVVLFYYQSWGQSIDKRIEVLNKAVKSAGIDAIFTQYKKGDRLISGWNGNTEFDCNNAISFRKELDIRTTMCKFEYELDYVKGLIQKYRHINRFKYIKCLIHTMKSYLLKCKGVI